MTATQDIKAQYVTPHEIRCGGIRADGNRCDKLLCRNLVGRVDIKCRCGYDSTYFGRPIALDDLPDAVEPDGEDSEPIF
jgi:hypothetical protein